jgi:hypothetical protein
VYVQHFTSNCSCQQLNFLHLHYSFSHFFFQCEHPYITPENLVVVGGSDLQQRKKMLVAESEAIISLPGGTGTWDELWEMACSCGIGFRSMPIAVVNADGFYEGFRIQLEKAAKDGLLYVSPSDVIYFASCAEDALHWCLQQLNSPRFCRDSGSAEDVQPTSRAHLRRQESLQKVEVWKRSHASPWGWAAVLAGGLAAAAAATVAYTTQAEL